jgi:hypothetical protein
MSCQYYLSVIRIEWIEKNRLLRVANRDGVPSSQERVLTAIDRLAYLQFLGFSLGSVCDCEIRAKNCRFR